MSKTTSQYAHRIRKFSIELDCPPGNPRPSDLIGYVLVDTGLEVSDFETGNPFFGNQMWVLLSSAGKDEQFTAAKPTIKSRVEELYNRGIIRYGSW